MSPEVVFALHVLAGIAWLYPLLTRFPSGLRTIRGIGAPGDRKRTAMWFMAFVQVGYVVRWLLYPGAYRTMSLDELAMWGGLHLLSAAACVALMWANGIEDGH